MNDLVNNQTFILFTYGEMGDFTGFIEGFLIGFAILVILASVGLYIYMMYYLVINDHWAWVAVIASMTFCIGCGVSNMDCDDLL